MDIADLICVVSDQNLTIEAESRRATLDTGCLDSSNVSTHASIHSSPVSDYSMLPMGPPSL